MSTEALTIETPLVNSRQELFCQALVAGHSQSEAYRMAGYSNRTCRHTASTLLTNINIQRRVAELRQLAEDASIMTIVERKQRLSEIGRARLVDFHNPRGVLKPFEGPNQGALSEVQQEYDLEGREAYPVRVKLHDPTKAIDLLNKMEGSYSPALLEVSGRNGKPIEVRETRERLIGIIARLSIRTRDTESDIQS